MIDLVEGLSLSPAAPMLPLVGRGRPLSDDDQERAARERARRERAEQQRPSSVECGLDCVEALLDEMDARVEASVRRWVGRT